MVDIGGSTDLITTCKFSLITSYFAVIYCFALALHFSLSSLSRQIPPRFHVKPTPESSFAHSDLKVGITQLKSPFPTHTPPSRVYILDGSILN